MDHRVAAAVRENAEWCDLVCRSHRLPTAFGDRAWHTPRRSPPFYPDAVTLHPAATPDEVLAPIDVGPGCSVKDSFATLDLAPHGFRVLFDAEWIHRPASIPAAATTWLPTRSGVPDDPSVTAFEGPGGRVVAHLSASVVGLSNLAVTLPDLATSPPDLAASPPDLAASPPDLAASPPDLAASPPDLDGEPIDRAWAEAVNAIAAAYPGRAVVGYEATADLPPARRAGFTTTGPLRVWIKPD